MKHAFIILAVALSGCNGQSASTSTTDLQEAPITTITAPAKQASNNFTPIGNLYSSPYVTTATEPTPQVSQAIFDDITGAIDGINLTGKPNTIYGGYIYQTVSEAKNFEDYEFNVTFNYRYAITMDIYVDDGLCVTGKYWQGKWLFSNPNATCLMNLSDPPQYEYDDFINMYGYLSVDIGRNFDAYVVRDGSFSAVWFIEQK